ncbi:glutamine--tRNA ligase/YqeY domain fusion protein [Paenibacillus sp. WLX1005]|uniref:glutamine--tRNA ligase/YqeY domain fusion protein n=1 Tax=Paenibacillus sp. WLX1005 TaxID=3243766 RepID=UPI003983EBCC
MLNTDKTHFIEHEPAEHEHFITRIIKEDVAAGTFSRPIATRFPPEPNGYLHIGSAFAIILNVSMAQQFDGNFVLRFDDTNPLKEDEEYVHAIIRDLAWLGYRPAVHYGSDYSEEYYAAAIQLINKGKAYVCDLTPVEMAQYRGTLTEKGTDSPYRNRSIEENLKLLSAMRAGQFATGEKVLRARIDMGSPNMNLRDPVLYRIIHTPHYRTGKEWCIYPMYDFAHPIQDWKEGITHSLCSIEFKEHRPLYDWVLHELDIAEPPKQREFGRLNISGVVTSKRYLRQLVEGGYVDGWDDPRLPTLQGMRRRGYTADSIHAFFRDVGMIRANTTVDLGMLEHAVRQDLKPKAISAMVVLNPVKVIITNYDAAATEWLEVENHPQQEHRGTRLLPFTREIWIEREDVMEVPERGFHRLSPGVEVRLKGAYFIRCQRILHDPDTGEISEVHCTYDPDTRSGSGFDARKVKSTIHWVAAHHAVPVEVHVYHSLLTEESEVKHDSNTSQVLEGSKHVKVNEDINVDEGVKPDAESHTEHNKVEDDPWHHRVRSDSRIVMKHAVAEPMLLHPDPEAHYQFIRHGYFVTDSRYSRDDHPVFNRVVSLKDSWKRS